MRRRPFRSGISWLLAMVLVRTLIPAGFMPAWVDGALTLVLCDGHAYRSGAAAHQHHRAGVPAPSPAHSPSDDCSYAQSASPALAFTITFTSTGSPQVSWIRSATRTGEWGVPPLRYASARGPPALA